MGEHCGMTGKTQPATLASHVGPVSSHGYMLLVQLLENTPRKTAMRGLLHPHRSPRRSPWLPAAHWPSVLLNVKHHTIIPTAIKGINSGPKKI